MSTVDEKAKAFDVISEAAFGVRLNMNDTFAYGCADTEDLDWVDIDLMVPIMAQFGASGLVAYAATKRNETPLKMLQSENYFAAMAAIEEIRKTETWFARDEAWWRENAQAFFQKD